MRAYLRARALCLQRLLRGTPPPRRIMAWLVCSLLDSQLVARFQRRCGLFPATSVAAEGGAGAARAVGNGSSRLSLRRDSPAKQHSPRPPPGCATCNGSPGSAWELVMYIGQVSKDLLKWPRPYSPPVVKLEKRTNAEYGMPSTHAMAATTISFTFVITTVSQYKYSLDLGIIGAALFSTMVCLSRIYTGMHSVLDVIIGSLISAVLIALAYPTWDFIDHLILTSPLCPVFCIVVPLVLCYNYPKLDHYSPTRADTTTILGAAAGAVIGFWVNNFYVLNTSAEAIAHSIPSITGEMLLKVLAKFLIGISTLVITRQLVKRTTLKTLCSWYSVSTSDLETIQQIEIEVPYKFITYASIGFNATVLVPLLHEFLGLN
ncbi:sphingosine-1-phosphate phosphatase 2 isoform X2 [Hemicordylus capensis]|uniref:sphingosine-1-phosphate phosphatase 2 isoform X2 n=1 Tax=Hemicordylus capensis TaxID=884348 RepID=UPI002303069D|nr:sphingosine-1-phosphate phosphatase 2 isoform X2 [Hemicordylus capensis]